jgi:hypothetical protein
MLTANIGLIRAFGKTGSGNYEVLDLSKVRSAADTVKSQREALALIRADYVARIDGDAEGKVGVTPKGLKPEDGEIQFAPTPAVLAAIDAQIAALSTCEGTLSAVDFPTA